MGNLVPEEPLVCLDDSWLSLLSPFLPFLVLTLPLAGTLGVHSNRASGSTDTRQRVAKRVGARGCPAVPGQLERSVGYTWKVQRGSQEEEDPSPLETQPSEKQSNKDGSARPRGKPGPEARWPELG